MRRQIRRFFGGWLGIRVHLTEREMTKHEPQLETELLAQRIHDGMGQPTMGTFVVAIFDKGNRCPGEMANMVMLRDWNFESGHVRSRLGGEFFESIENVRIWAIPATLACVHAGPIHACIAISYLAVWDFDSLWASTYPAKPQKQQFTMRRCADASRIAQADCHLRISHAPGRAHSRPSCQARWIAGRKGFL
jgi:hypothetical protein